MEGVVRMGDTQSAGISGSPIARPHTQNRFTTPRFGLKHRSARTEWTAALGQFALRGPYPQQGRPGMGG